MKFQWYENVYINEMPIEIDRKSSWNSMKYQWKLIGNPVKISIKYQWKSIGNPVEISMKYQWKSIGNKVEMSIETLWKSS